ncbi:alpha/beta hydrolase [Actinoallomurus purpureus]|uniref:alpha/beta fold hydrolase n=1 Tax=Actinoallomurus purpureus TaxID=478114 RepID=UPI0020930924|nr:alpha/beta hydrolase [Actinoallomurus purpureus]MCO6006236.1 alpha/beta hydrolase [Actinoallomurus purpureus]
MAVQLYCRDVGDGTPLVLLHAFPLSSAMWLAQREALSARFRVVTPDLRGFGGSPLGTADPSVDVMADDVAALLDAKGIDRAVVGGLSMGGYVTLAFCRRHADRVLGVVLADTKATADTDTARATRLRIAERLESDQTVDVLLEELLPRLVGPTTMRQRALIYGRVRGLVQSAPPSAAAWAQRAMAARPDALEMLAGLQAPALVIHGAEDAVATAEDARAMAEALPNAELVLVPRSGHLTAVEQPQPFNEAVAAFAAALGRTTR